MKRLGFNEYQNLISGGKVLTRDTRGAKVVKAVDGRNIKLFRTKRLLSASRLNPYAARFARNAALLTKLGIATVKVHAVYRVPEIERDIVIYRRLEGKTLRDTLSRSRDDARHNVLGKLAILIAALHRQGVLFRSIHFGNVLVTGNGYLGLIDVADLRKRRFGALTLRQRIRNFRHMLRYPEDRAALKNFGVERFISHYASADTIAPRDGAYLTAALRNLLSDPTP